MDNRQLMKIREKLKKENVFFVQKNYYSKEEIVEKVRKSHPEIIQDLEKLSSFDDYFDYFYKSTTIPNMFDFAFEVDEKINENCLFYILEQIYKFELQSLCFLSLSEDLKYLRSSSVKEVLSHMENYVPHNIDFVKNLLNKFPEYSFTGSAFRLIKTHDYIPSQIEGVSFSLSKKGILNYLSKDFFDPERPYTFVEHNVIGFNLIRFLFDHQSEISHNDKQFIFDIYKGEDEVLIAEDLGEVSIFKFKNTEELIAFLNN